MATLHGITICYSYAFTNMFGNAAHDSRARFLRHIKVMEFQMRRTHAIHQSTQTMTTRVCVCACVLRRHNLPNELRGNDDGRVRYHLKGGLPPVPQTRRRRRVVVMAFSASHCRDNVAAPKAKFTHACARARLCELHVQLIMAAPVDARASRECVGMVRQ